MAQLAPRSWKIQFKPLERKFCLVTHMNNTGAGKVFVESSLGQPAGPVPGPVRDWGINPASENDGVSEVGEELASLGNGSGHDGGGGGSEDELRENYEVLSFYSKYSYLEKPLWILFIGHLIVEVLGSTTEWISIGTVSQTPANSPELK